MINYDVRQYVGNSPGAYQTDIDSTVLNLLHASVVKSGYIDSVFESMKK